MSTRIRSAASPASHDIALPRRSCRSARSSSVWVSPSAASCSASLRVRSWWLAADPAERVRDDPEHDRRDDPEASVRVVVLVHEPEPEHERQDDPDADRRKRQTDQPQQQRDVARPLRAPGEDVEDSRRDRSADEQERAGHVEEQQPLHGAHRARAYAFRRMDTARDRHLKLLTETIEAVNSTLDLARGALAGRDERRECARGGRVLRLPLRRAGRRARPARDARDERRRDDAPSRGCGPARGSPGRPRPSARR